MSILFNSSVLNKVSQNIGINGLNGAGERNQGYFNAGLFATNLINAFHSLGIGTCLIQFSNKVEDEEKLKN